MTQEEKYVVVIHGPRGWSCALEPFAVNVPGDMMLSLCKRNDNDGVLFTGDEANLAVRGLRSWGILNAWVREHDADFGVIVEREKFRLIQETERVDNLCKFDSTDDLAGKLIGELEGLCLRMENLGDTYENMMGMKGAAEWIRKDVLKDARTLVDAAKEYMNNGEGE